MITWEIQHGPTRQTLAEWGFDTCSLTFGSQAADKMTLSAPVEDYGDNPIFAHEAAITLWRVEGGASQRWFQGIVLLPEVSANGTDERHSYTVHGPWHYLDQLQFLQKQASWTEGEVEEPGEDVMVEVSNALFGADENGDSVGAAQMLANILAYAAAAGAPVAVGTITVANIAVPPFQSEGRTCAQMIREVIRWLPDCVAYFLHGPDTPTFNVKKWSACGEVTTPGEGGDLTDLTLTPRYDLVREGVIITYSLIKEVPDPAGEEGEDATKFVRRIVRDVWPEGGGNPLKRLHIDMDRAGGDGAAGGRSRPSMSYASQRIIAETYPQVGADVADVVRWWRNHYVPLNALVKDGLDKDLLKAWDLTETTAEGGKVYRHKVILKDTVPPVDPPPRTRGSKLPRPLPEDIEEVPRQLIGGTLQEWFPESIITGRAIARASLGIKKSDWEALTDEDVKAQAAQFFGVQATVENEVYLMHQAQGAFTVTNARTKVYRTVSGYDAGSGASETEEPPAPPTGAEGLAKPLQESLSVLHYEGQWEITEQECSRPWFLGNRLNFTHPKRSAWATARALIQEVREDIARGTTSVRIGPPGHLAFADLAELAANRRRQQPVPTGAWQQIGDSGKWQGAAPVTEMAELTEIGIDSVPVSTGGATAEVCPLSIYKTADGVAVRDGTIAGEFPVIGTTPINSSPKPTLPHGPNKLYYVEISIKEDGTPNHVRKAEFKEGTKPADTWPVYNPSTGHTTTDGKFRVYVGSTDADGKVTPLLCGNQGVNFCVLDETLVLGTL